MPPVDAGRRAAVGVAESGNTAVVVTVTDSGVCLDRRTVRLTEGLPTHPYHHEGAWAMGRYLQTPGARSMSMDQVVALVGRVEAAAGQGAVAALDEVAAAVAVPIVAVALRVCPALPPTIEARIRDPRAQTMADSVMYRQAMARAAGARGWHVSWYDRDDIRPGAGAAGGRPAPSGAAGHGDEPSLIAAMGRAVGPPWQAAHKLAAAAALAALRTTPA